MSFPSYLLTKPTGSNLLSAGKAHNLPLPSFIKGISTLHLYVILTWVIFDCIYLLQSITQIFYINAIMLIGASNQEIESNMDLLIKHFCVRWWEIESNKIQKSCISVRFLRVQWYEALINVLSKVKGESVFGFWKQHHYSLVCVSPPPHAFKSCSF